MTRISLAGRFFTAILLAALLAFAPLALTDRALAIGVSMSDAEFEGGISGTLSLPLLLWLTCC